MNFTLLPLLDVMIGLYRKPRGMERFNEYIRLALNREGNDLKLPIAGYNPMAREHVLMKLHELKALQAEAVMARVMATWPDPKTAPGRTFKTALVLADDLKGGWTNRYTTDYGATFRLKAMIKRGFCLPIFWSSEVYDTELIGQRTREAMARVEYQLEHGEPETLEEHIRQEAAVSAHGFSPGLRLSDAELEKARAFYEANRATTDYPTLFAFLYGDEAARELGYKPLGFGPFAGFRFAATASHYFDFSA